MKRKGRQFKIKPTICRVIHKPTFCFIQSIDIETEKPTVYDRHKLSAFREKKEIQSNQSQNRMKNALNWLFMFAERKNIYSKTAYVDSHGKLRHNFSFRLAFITLTLSKEQKHDDNYIKEHMLQPFLYWLTRAHKCNYVWKAETQLNGNIHFHITIDTFIPWRSVRAKWNSILATHGYCKIFQDGTNDAGDAATQIKAIRNEDGMAKIIGGYLTKNSIEEKYHSEFKKLLMDKANEKLQELIDKGNYISQSLQTRLHYTRIVEGRIWGCTESLSNITCFIDENDFDFKTTEHQFFHDNKVKRLSSILIDKEKNGRTISIYDEVELNKKYYKFRNVFIHKHLKYCKVPEELQKKLSLIKSKYKCVSQKSFTVDSLI